MLGCSGSIKRATMEVVRLDDELRAQFPQLKGRVGAVKMDIEGAELLVSWLAGTRQLSCDSWLVTTTTICCH